jgi:hypothetical protein
MTKLVDISPQQKIAGIRSLEIAAPRTISVPQINGGMIADIDPTDIKDNASPLIRNSRIRRDKTSRRFGKVQFLSDKLNSEQVSALIQLRVSNKTTYFIKTTDQTIQFVDDTSGAAWEFILHVLAGRITDHAIVFGDLIIADGVKQIRVVDLDAKSANPVGLLAPTAKYVTGFSERVVAANGGSGDAASETIYWSGNRNFDEWDTLEDISAGQKRLDTSPRTVVDPISGVFGFSSVMVLPREFSIWVAQQNPVASDPFKLFRAVPGVGTNMPGSIAIGRELLMFLDSRMRDLVVYTPGSNVETIGLPIRNTIIKDIANADIIESTYLINEQEYYLLITEKSTVKIWIFNFLTQAWTYDELPNCTSVDVVDGLSDYTSFDDLVGTFDSLTGTFDGLSSTPVDSPELVFGFDNGDIVKENADFEKDTRESIPTGVEYTFEFQSREFKDVKRDITVNRIEIEYQATRPGVVTLEYSKNGGISWVTAKSVMLKIGKVEILKFKKQITSRRFMWRVLSTDGAFDLIGYETDIVDSGESRN